VRAVEEPVLTLRQPWASAVFRAGKNVENRTWSTPYRGRLWIHAAKNPRREDSRRQERRGLWLPEEPLPRGVILGCVELVDVVERNDSPWALRDHFHWLLRRPMLLKRPVARDGRLGLAYIRPPRGELVRVRR
jgi:hypothetical protein